VVADARCCKDNVAWWENGENSRKSRSELEINMEATNGKVAILKGSQFCTELHPTFHSLMIYLLVIKRPEIVQPRLVVVVIY
jgi:hypothetical protein